MNVAYYYDRKADEICPEYRAMAAISILSVKKHMPQVRIIHLADEKVAPLYGVHEVMRWGSKNRPMSHSEVLGDSLFMDVDTVVRRDVSHVFLHDFDVAVVDRKDEAKHPLRPYNSGVTFSRSKAFWEAVDRAFALKDMETAFNSVATSGRFKVKVLPNSYNFVPDDGAEEGDNAIVHYKGIKKPLMLERHIAV